MLGTHRPDYRRSSEAELLKALAGRDPLALAEAYHRTVPAAHACARRLLGPPSEVEALLLAVYSELWANPPAGRALESWIRARSFALASEHLRELGRAPAERVHDPVEGLLAELDTDARAVLFAAHFQGVSTADAPDPRAAAAALESALLALAGPGADGGAEQAPECSGLPLGDWVLGLLAPELATKVENEVSAREACAARARILRRGRRRLEGLPPTADMGQRVLVSVLAQQPAPAPPATDVAADEPDELPSALDVAPVVEPVTLDEPPPPAAAVDEPVAPVDEPVTLDEPAPSTAAADVAEDEEWPWEDEAVAGQPRRSATRRVLGILGVLLLVALGSVVGMLVGSMVVGR